MRGFTTSLGGIVAGILTIVGGAALPGAFAGTLLTGVFVVATPLLAVGGAGVLLYSQKLRRDANKELEERIKTLRESYRQSLVEMTDRERTRLLQYGQQILGPVFSQIEVLVKRYQDQADKLAELTTVAQELRTELDNILVKIAEPDRS